MNFFERRKRLKGANYLELTPIRSVEFETDLNNQITLLLPKFTNAFAKRYIEPRLRTTVFRLKLDELGSASWLAIDGNKNVSTIAEGLLVSIGEKIQPVEERLTKFLTLLYEQRYITFQELERN
jgi:Coenzyme PQQ synthesis protein D (PqqD)